MSRSRDGGADGPAGGGLLRQRVEQLERQLIEESLRRSSGNHTRAAAELGLSRFGLLKKLRRYGMIRDPREGEPAPGPAPRSPGTRRR